MNTKLQELLFIGKEKIEKISEKEFSFKEDGKWSKKEILGHLIDSGINNLQRFTEIQFEEKPYLIRKYNQNELVKANQYQQINSKELINLWLAINYQILQIIASQTETTLSYSILIDKEIRSDLRFLISDYISHLEHHLFQIIEKE
jgi:hypothetical protein